MVVGATERACAVGFDNNDNFNVNANDNLNNDNPALRIACPGLSFKMKTYRNLWQKLCSWDNLILAYDKARLHKENNPKVKAFEKNWKFNLALLKYKLMNKTYKPLPLKTFVLRDPKTRVISVSEFRDRVIHHALINILQPIFEPMFIADSFANRKGKGTLAAIERFDVFKRKVTNNGMRSLRGGDIGLMRMS